MFARPRSPALIAFLLVISIPGAAIACGDCEYSVCPGCPCLPKSGCIVPPAIDPGKFTEKTKHDPIGAVINPFGPYNPTGIPLQGDVMEIAIKNPDQVIEMIQHPELIPYAPVAVAMITTRNAVIANGANRIPIELLPFLRRWYPNELLNSVRWTSNWGALNATIPATQMYFKPRTQAMTFLNVVVFKNDDVAHDRAIWAHELVHVQQYGGWGVQRFAKEWVDNSADRGPVEAPAYEREDEAERLLAAPPPPPPQPYRALAGWCKTPELMCPLAPPVPMYQPCSCINSRGLPSIGRAE